jgi:dihydroxyacetone kinase
MAITLATYCISNWLLNACALEGITCETLAVTDDICSAKEDERDKRRGVAGDLVVFKIAAAAAERGASLADVLNIARRANDNTRTVGIAFTGCTLPGAGSSSV